MATQPLAGQTAQQGWHAAPIFISYRRSEGTKDARALYERLLREFGKGQVFVDLGGIPPGAHFVRYLEFQLDHCQVLVALIGRDWTKPDASGLRRYDDEADFVRIEIGTAIRRGIEIFPVLTDDARPPVETELPPELQDLAQRQALSLDFGKFDDDVARLARGIRAVLDSRAPEPAIDPLEVPAPGRGPANPHANADRPSATPTATRESDDPPSPPGPPVVSRHFRFLWPIGLAAVALAAAVALVTSPFLSGIEVPELRGKSPREATQILQDAGLRRGALTSRVTTDVQRNTVIDQRPAAGTRAKRQQPVDMLIAETPVKPPAPPPAVTGAPEITAFQQTKASPTRVHGTVSYQLHAVPMALADKFFMSFAAIAADDQQAPGTVKEYFPLKAPEGSVSVSVRAAPAGLPGPREFDTREFEACILGPEVGPKDFGPTLVCKRFPRVKNWVRP